MVKEGQKPALAMFAMQLAYAGLALFTRAALLQGTSPRVFVVYRHAVATLVLAPIAYFTRRKSTHPPMGLKSFSLIFIVSLFGITMNQNMYSEGIYLASSSMATAMSNLVPAVTFAIAAMVGLEKVDIRRLRSIAKIVGTLFCVGGAVCMALLRGPKLLNSEWMPTLTITKHLTSSQRHDDWLLGCLYLFGSCCCWSIWLILQVSASATYPDHLSFVTWLCFLSTIQSAALTFFLEPDLEAWQLHSIFEVACFLYAGIIGSAFSFIVQAWCVAKRGPLYTAMFNPLCTIIVTILAACFLHEEIYSGSVVGAIAVIIGLYVVLWGKAEDNVAQKEEMDLKKPNGQVTSSVEVLIDDGSTEGSNFKEELKEPLLADKINY